MHASYFFSKQWQAFNGLLTVLQSTTPASPTRALHPGPKVFPQDKLTQISGLACAAASEA